MIDIDFALVDFSNVSSIVLNVDGTIEIQYHQDFLPALFVGA